MSINWVMLHDREGFVRLPNERLICSSPPRTSFSLQPLGSSSGKTSFSIQSSAGRVYLTNQRVRLPMEMVYLPAQETQVLQSFSAPLLNIHDSHVSAPFFGPNVWVALIQPVSGGGIPPSLPAVQMKLSFKEGGAFDFHTDFERIKERLNQAVDVSREHDFRTVDVSAIDLEQLPAYDGRRTDQTEARQSHLSASPDPQQNTGGPPDMQSEPLDPPPGYEEVQQQSVANALEESLRRSG